MTQNAKEKRTARKITRDKEKKERNIRRMFQKNQKMEKRIPKKEHDDYPKIFGGLLRDISGDVICVCDYQIIISEDIGGVSDAPSCEYETEEIPRGTSKPRQQTLVECIREIIREDPTFAPFRSIISDMYPGIY